MRLKGRVAIVTGGGRGIGKAIALTFAREGAEVAVTARTESEISAVADEIRTLGRKAAAVPCDVTQEGSVNAMVERVVKELGEPYILVNNAGVMIVGDVASVEADNWIYGITVSLTGAFLCSKAVLKYMILRRGGKIINMASRAAKISSPHVSSYSAAKFGLIGLTKSLSDEVKKLGINVNAICPGFVDTKMVRDGVGSEQSWVPSPICLGSVPPSPYKVARRKSPTEPMIAPKNSNPAQEAAIFPSHSTREPVCERGEEGEEEQTICRAAGRDTLSTTAA